MDGYAFRGLREDDLGEIVEFVMKHFKPNEPMASALNLPDEEYREICQILLKDALPQHVSIGVYDKKTKELVAVRVNVLGKHQDKLWKPDEAEKEKFPLTIRQLDVAVETFFGKDLSVTLGTKDYFELLLVSVREDYGQRGIATELYRRSEELAKQHGCAKMALLASSAYTLAASLSLGFEIKKQIPYAEYMDKITGEKVFKDMKRPHKVMALVVKTLC